MSKKKVLIVTQEMEPYTNLSIVSKIVRQLPSYIQKQGMDIRILMPRFGTINERRHRLHEVVRLSGMNIIVDEDDYPLIIKVASLPGARLQVYFLDNDEFFRRKMIFEDKEGNPFSDNAERMVFFCKGVMETVRKFGWPPDLIHCHGWMTSLIPLYLKKAYKNDPIFTNSKVVYSIYSSPFENTLEDRFLEKASINNLDEGDLNAYLNGTGLNLHHGALNYADATILGKPELKEEVADLLDDKDHPVFLPESEDVEEILSEYMVFYNNLFEKEEEGEKAPE
ncbi:glycogen/starch synthase [Membranihabitans maritimus]|uniref:glycogen/starch synthase n=1 Tax=Membranihabitans maritimus TaxID=2904244 RepID=UPI001F44C2ED|nr:glycogen/starch synthase [Membranihabitans maritimus]